MSTNPETLSDWQAVGDIAARHLGKPHLGCRDCGTIIRFTTSTGHDAYCPGVECCANAIKRQISWRHQEVEALQKRRAEREQQIEVIRETLDELPTRTARAAAEARLERSERNFSQRDREEFMPQVRALNTEVARLKAKLTALNRPTPPA